MMVPIKQIAVIRKLDNRNSKTVRYVVQGIETFCKNNNIPLINYGDELISFDQLDIPTLVVSIGGDGTMLYAAKESLKFDRAYLLGINAGNLGFLTDKFEGRQEFNTLLHSIVYPGNDTVKLDKRNILYAEYGANNGSMKTAYALNEFFVSASKNHAPIQYKVSVNDQPLAEQSGSGIMVATATGSTAFALSSGGAIMHPTTNAIQIVPVNAHSLTARPVVLSGARDEVEITVPVTKRVEGIELQVDGQAIQTFTHMPEPFTIRIKSYDKVVKIVRRENWHFFATLSEKLGWK